MDEMKEIRYDGKLIRVETEMVRSQNGEESLWERVVHPGASAIVPMVAPDEVVLLEQYRYAVDRKLLEIPAGVIEPGETPEECAAREIVEETGYRAGKLTKIIELLPSPGVMSEVIHIYKAEELEKVSEGLLDEENLRLVRMKISEAIGLIDRGEIVDGKTICALFFVAR